MKPWVLAGLVVVSSVAHAAVEDDLRDGDKFFEAGDWHRAATAFDRAIAKAPGQVPAEAYGKRAAVFIILGDYQGGLEFIRRAKARSSALATAPALLEQEALILWETDRKDDAIEVAEQVIAARPQAFTNQKLIGEYYSTRNPTKTVTAYEAYLAHRPRDLESGDVLARLRLGFAYLATARATLGDGDEGKAQQLYTEAAEQFDIVQRKHGKQPNAQVNADNGLCAAYTGMGRFDQAVTVCERVLRDPKHIDATGSVWFNLGTAYLARRQTTKARSAATEFTRMRQGEARGLILTGDTYFAERDWKSALDYYLRAEKAMKVSPRDRVQLSIRLGKTYRRMPAPPSGPNGNLALAIAKLSSAFAANPDSTELGLELGGAYLEGKQDAKASALTERMLDAQDTAALKARASVLVLSGKALFNQHELREARQRIEAALQLRPSDVTIRRSLVITINEQAFEAAKDRKAAQALLEQALALDPSSPITLTNLAVLAIDRGDCEGAQQQLQRLAQLRGHDEVLRTRLLARTYLCSAKPDRKKASEVYAVAEREAKQANTVLALAEIYTEWAPLIWDADLDGAIAKLEIAAQTSAQAPTVAAAAKRNLALALFRRGSRSMRDHKPADAALDFERALRDPSVLEGTEALAFEFSFALAQLDAGRAAAAAKLFGALGSKGNQGAYLKGPYAKLGTAFFAAYASSRNGTPRTHQQTAAELQRLEGEPGVGDKIKDLLASAWEVIAYDQWRAGQLGSARTSLATAEKSATGDAKRRITMDRAALSLGPGDLPTLEGLAGNPPEALVNLGILYERAGRPKDAYDAWLRAKARGAQGRDLQKWIDAKKRIYGY